MAKRNKKRISENQTLLTFLSFLDQDMEIHPEKIVPLDEETLLKFKALTQNVKYSDKDFE